MAGELIHALASSRPKKKLCRVIFSRGKLNNMAHATVGRLNVYRAESKSWAVTRMLYVGIMRLRATA